MLCVSLCKNAKDILAFTLAEVLIVLSIIGVVAAMTIPVLMQKQSDMATVTAVKKIYATLTNAYQSAVNENGTPENWNTSSQVALNTLLKYMKVTKNCETAAGCLPSSYSNYSAQMSSDYDTADFWSKAILADGSLIFYWPMNAHDCQGNRSAGNGVWTGGIFCGDIFVDINGYKGPNRFNKDVFGFYLLKTGIVPSGSGFANSQYGNCTFDFGSAYCTAWVLYKENTNFPVDANEAPSGS